PKHKAAAEETAKQDKKAQEQKEAEAKRLAEEKAKKDLENKKLLGLVQDSEEEQEEPIIKKKETKEEVKREPATPHERKQKAKEFDKALQDKKEDIKKSEDKKDANNKEDNNKTTDKKEVSKETKGLLEGIKEFFGLTNLQKADRELKAILSVNANGLKEVQALLKSFETKYKLTREEQAKLMDDNADAIKALIEKDADKNFTPYMLYTLTDKEKESLKAKKYEVVTRFDTSTIAGPIQDYQYFKIHLDDKLTVIDPSSLKPIEYNGKVIATPSYNKTENTITYKITNDITENIQVPLNIPVDYNVDNITLDEEGKFTVRNKISGLGVTDPKSLPAQKVNTQGEKVGVDPGSLSGNNLTDTTYFFDPNSNYKVNFNAKSYPVVENGEMTAIDWEITFDANGQDLKNDLGLLTNFTAVEGSGIGKIRDIKLNGQPISAEDNNMGDKFLLNDSKNVAPTNGSKYVYTFRTDVVEKRESYVLDVAGILNKKNKTGAVRLVQDGYEKGKVEAGTPTRIITTNRVTNKGEFLPNNQIRWVVTEEVSSGDPGSLPLVTRTLSDNQKLDPLKVSYYAPNPKTGKMEKVGQTQSTGYPIESGSLGETPHKPGTIAVYEYITNITPGDKAGYSLGDNKISEYGDVDVNIKWSTIKGENPPAETITLTPKSENGEKVTLNVPARKAGEPYEFNTKIPNVKKWEVGADGKATPIKYTLSQKFPADKTENGKKISYREVNVFYDPHERRFEVRNQIAEVDDKKPANITIKKTDDKGEALAGARFQLVGNDQTYEAITGDDGKLVFSNIQPGKYILSESEAPIGYVRDNGQDTITVNNDGTVSWNTTNLVDNVSGSASSSSSNTGGLTGSADRYTTKIKRRDYPDGVPQGADFMNTISYTEYEDGSVTAYIMLKPKHNQGSSGTDKDTRLAIMPDNIEINGIEMYDANHGDNKNIFNGVMEAQDMLSWQVYLDDVETYHLKVKLPYDGGIENNPTNKNKIRSYTNVNDNFLKKNIAAIDIPKARFNADWAYIVKVDGRVVDKNKESDVAFSWYPQTNPETNWKIMNVTNPIPSKADREKEAEEGGKVANAELKVTNTKAKTHPVKVTKKDKNGNTLAGAEFIMTDSNGNIVKRGRTDANGIIEFKDLPEGIYELKESNPPEGYKDDEIRFEVTVTKSGQILYQAYDKNGNPIAQGDKYLIGKNQGPSVNGPPSESRIEVLKKSMTLNERNGYGSKPGVWEEASYESYNFDLELNIRNKRGGDKFTINFDKNWNLSQWTDEMPVIKDGYGNVIARPSMDYDNNVLTYTLTDAVTGKDNVRANVFVKGVRPSKYYVKNDGVYYFTDTINTGDTVETINTRVDAYLWVFYGTAGQMRYITQNVDTYNAGTQDKPQYMMRDVTIYNPDGLRPSGDRTMRIFYGATKDPNPTVFNNKIEPAHSPTKVVVWKVRNPNPDTMPLSGGVKPSENPGTYEKVAEFDVSNTDRLNKSEGGVFFSYDEKRAGPNKTPDLRSMDNVQFKITLPNDKNGYVIENFYKVNDEKLFRSSYTQTIALYKTDWGNTAGMAQFRPNPNRAASSSGTSVDVEEPNYDLTVFNKKSDKGKFTITKYGKDNGVENILPQAYFRLTDSNGKIVKEDYSSPAGLVTFDELDPGTYTLTETRAPEGFKPIDKKVTVTVSEEGKVTFGGEGIYDNGPYTVTTPASPEIKVDTFQQPDIFNTNPYPEFMNMSAKLKSEDGNKVTTRIFLNPRIDSTLGQGPDRPTTLVIKHNWAKDVNVDVYRYPAGDKGSMDTASLKHFYIDKNIKVNKSNYETTIKFPTDQTKRWGGAGYVVVAEADFNEGEQNKYISYQWKSDTDATVLPAEPNNLGIKRTVPDFPPGSLKAVNEKSDTEIIIKKVDEDHPDTLIEGAEFTLLNKDLNKVLAQRTTGKDGLAKFEDLTPGTYYIKETKVPEGYKDPNKRWKVVVDENKKVTITPQTVKTDESGAETPGNNTDPGNTDPTTPEDPITPPADNGLTYSIRNFDKIGVLYNGNFAGKLGSTLKETGTKGVFDLSVDFDRAYGIKNQPTELKIQFDTDRFDIRPAEGKLDGNIYTVSNFDPYHENGNASYKFTVIPKAIKAGFTGSPIKYTQFGGELVYPTHATISASKTAAFNVLDLFRSTTSYASSTPTWEKVDLSKSTQRSTRETDDVKTQVTQIDKANNKYRQVFIVNKTGQVMGGPTVDFHAWPENRGISKQNFRIVSVRPVNSSSTPTNLVAPGANTNYSTQNHEVNGYNRTKITISTSGVYDSRTFAIEVEYDYPESGAIGLGANYVRRSGEAPQWAAQQFYSEAEVNKEPEVTYMEIEEESIIPIPDEPIRRANPDMIEGIENVFFEGETGRKVVVYRQKYVGDRPEGEREFVRENIITNAKPKIIEYGTKPKVVTREESKNVDQEIKYETTTIVDVNKKKGEKTTVTEGKNGKVTYKYTITYDTSEGLNASRPKDWPEDAPTANPREGERIVSYTKEEVQGTRQDPTTEVISIGLGIDPNEKVTDGKTEKVTPDGETKQIIYTISNKKEDTEIYFRKVAELKEGEAAPSNFLKGAKFELLYKAEGQDTFKNVVDKDRKNIKVESDTKGIFKFTDLKDGTYQVKEVSPPPGYRKPENEIVYTFKVKDKKLYKLDETNKETKISDNKEANPINISNKPGIFPYTGALGIFGFLIAGAIIMTTSYYKYRKKKRGQALS
ncbi:SpaA isopeptide-forming pilin-related protein, partial [Finegoldia magna]|uniref:SpaA isopeptide-forming pilin-related protein n=1 Tax=Finegoldia magna TaxID=1260 RepID=UPI0027B94AAA